MKWLPIALAPKDDSLVIVRYEIATVHIVHLAFYRNEESWNSEGKYVWPNETIDDWVGWWSNVNSPVAQIRLDGCRQPMHWLICPEI